MITTTTLPKYVQKANLIIDVLSKEPSCTWTKTQRELSTQLGFSLPELSALVRTLQEAGKIKRGESLPGVRGRTHSLILADSKPLDTPVRRELSLTHRDDDRVLNPDEAVTAPVEMASLNIERIGYAVMRTMRQAWENEERNSRMRSEQQAKIREFREQLNDERAIRLRQAEEKIQMERRLAEQEAEISRMRSEINQLLIHANQRRGDNNNTGTFQVKDMLTEDELSLLRNLMEEKPRS